jgi:hypothetical protein
MDPRGIGIRREIEAVVPDRDGRRTGRRLRERPAVLHRVFPLHVRAVADVDVRVERAFTLRTGRSLMSQLPAGMLAVPSTRNTMRIL